MATAEQEAYHRQRARVGGAATTAISQTAALSAARSTSAAALFSFPLSFVFWGFQLYVTIVDLHLSLATVVGQPCRDSQTGTGTVREV